MFTTITAAELKEKMAQNSVVLIDVREPFEHHEQFIPGAVHIPLGEIHPNKLPSGANISYVMQCRSGKRSAQACTKLLTDNPDLSIYNLEGGITAWHELGFETQSKKTGVISIERQTQIATGALTFAGVALGFLINSNFFFLAGFIGLGLIFAGISGTCTLGRILATMPWNK